MFFISDIYTKSPIKFDTPLQKEAYKILHKLDIDFECVDTDEAITMEDCVQINKKLNMKMVI
ncbi:TPA: proline--tRNA ligase [Clostridioides difficile]|nr:proline--tRNA ligase [Clostridioides difficile]HBF6480322.1 proline--tRNA ligase [Clostridioides difficile]HBF6526948.1 proline--tRNA ligase [Clostridioides difficile]HBG7857727.1 proline--tRNA ligase [Clostridioides difficile]